MSHRSNTACLAPLALLLAVAVCSAAALAAPPRVIKAVPDNGDVNVDPNLRQLSVTFDQDMGRGASWAGGGPTFPETFGGPRWISKRTCILKVRMEPNHTYHLSLNSPSPHFSPVG